MAYLALWYIHVHVPYPISPPQVEECYSMSAPPLEAKHWFKMLYQAQKIQYRLTSLHIILSTLAHKKLVLVFTPSQRTAV